MPSLEVKRAGLWDRIAASKSSAEPLDLLSSAQKEAFLTARVAIHHFSVEGHDVHHCLNGHRLYHLYDIVLHNRL